MAVVVWSRGGDLIVPREKLGGCGTQVAALAFGGTDGVAKPDTEEYGGTVWYIGGDLITARYGIAGAGTQTAGLGFGGYAADQLKNTEEYNGASWSAGGDLAVAKTLTAGMGTQTAGLTAGGIDIGYNYVTIAEEYDGTTWSNGGSLALGRLGLAGAGTQTAGLVFGGNVGGHAAYRNTEEYNGTVWSTGGDLVTAKYYLGGAGTQTAGINFGGATNNYVLTKTTEEYDGTTWSETSDMGAVIEKHSGCGVQTAALSFGGNDGAYSAITEEYTVFTIGNHRSVSGIDSGVLFNGKTMVGDRSNGKIYSLDMNTYTDGGLPISRTRRTQIINKERVNVLHHRVEVEFEPGVGLDVAEGEDGEDPQAVLKWSDDGGNTWSNGRSVSIGKYTKYGARAVWRGLGKSRNRIYELSVESPVKIVLIGAHSDLEACKR